MARALGVRMTHREALSYLWDRALGIKDNRLRVGCADILTNLRFINGYGSSTSSHSHHSYPGGLVIHTAEVLRGALALAEAYGADAEVLTVAAIWHDTHKTFEYEVQADGTVKKGEYARMFGHPAGAFANFVEHTDGTFSDNQQHANIAHCILSHHGRREWGAAVEPATVEAQILHYADMMSMQWGPGKVEEER